jgi:hypothetical protein
VDEVDAADGVLRVKPESTNMATPPETNRLIAPSSRRQRDASFTLAYQSILGIGQDLIEELL